MFNWLDIKYFMYVVFHVKQLNLVRLSPYD